MTLDTECLVEQRSCPHVPSHQDPVEPVKAQLVLLSALTSHLETAAPLAGELAYSAPWSPLASPLPHE